MGIRLHLVVRGKSHGFSGVAVGTCGIFSIYGGDGHSKLMFFQRSKISCIVMRDISDISTRLGRAIQMLLEMRRGSECPFLVATVILEFLSIFKKSQASSPFVALNSTCLSTCERV